jgi:two-component sensor histidine kinase/ActR/RegA family two-component response regulator
VSPLSNWRQTIVSAPSLKGGRFMSSGPIDSETHVLVVEDEMLLRMRAVEIVEHAGFTAIEAINADEALTILESRSDISLLFSDVQMPGSMDGLKLAHAVHDRWPSIKIILVSGQIDVSDADKPVESRFFGKPLEIEQMVAELRGMVGAGSLAIIAKPRVPISETEPESLTAENESLRLLLEQADLDAKALILQVGIDAKEREASDKLQTLIVEELHHRIKNTLAIVSVITSQSLRTAVTMEYGRKAIEARLGALGRAHDLLMQISWAHSSLANVISRAVEPYDGDGIGRFMIEGPEIAITSRVVIAFAMALNELCTNAIKYGALSVPAGRVEIAWTIDKMQRLELTWTEKGGPTVEAPTRRSFGTRLIGSLGQQLSGKVHLAYEPTGLVYFLDVPLSALTAKA